MLTSSPSPKDSFRAEETAFFFDPAVLFRACKRSIAYITSPSMLISWKSQVLSCCCKRQLDHYSSYEGVETRSCDSGVVLFLAEQRDLY